MAFAEANTELLLRAYIYSWNIRRRDWLIITRSPPEYITRNCIMTLRLGLRYIYTARLGVIRLRCIRNFRYCADVRRGRACTGLYGIYLYILMARTLRQPIKRVCCVHFKATRRLCIRWLVCIPRTIYTIRLRCF